MKSLLPLTLAAPIFAPWAGRRVGLVHSPKTGNTGDRMIELVAERLLQEFGVSYIVQEPDARTDTDALFLFGGGNYGHYLCVPEAQRRAKALATGKPCVLLPQTCYGMEPGTYYTAFVRDWTSQRMIFGSKVAPDLAMFYEPDRDIPLASGAGEFFTTSPEGLWSGRGVDPRHKFKDPGAYFEFIIKHERIITDSLHVAIFGLIAKRDVTIMPTRLHKNLSIWEAILCDMGCKWADR